MPSVVSALLLFSYVFSGTDGIFPVTLRKKLYTFVRRKRTQKATCALPFGRENEKKVYEAG